MTIDEAINELNEMRTDPWAINQQIEALNIAIKALKQYGALQEIMQEIFGNYRVQLKTDKPDDWWVKWNECIDECLEIVDKHIKEIEE